MIGLVIVTHGRLAEELAAAMEHIVGVQNNLEAICIGPDDDMENKKDIIQKAVENVDTNQGVIIVTDMFGGTPSNLAISLLETDKIEVIAGVNLPLLVKLAEARHSMSLNEAAFAAKEAGQKYIAVASDVLSGIKKNKKS